MFGQIGPTPYDLYFTLFGIPVRVHPSFWIVGAIFGWDLIRMGPEYLLIWIACLFVSILIHEMGHALTAKFFGWPPQVYLYHFGGLAVFTPGFGYTTWRSILISFAGPAAGFLFFGIIFCFEVFLALTDTPANPHLDEALAQLVWINLVWGLVNLLPVLPLDGGRIMQALCVKFRPYDGNLLAFRIGMLVAGGVAALFFSIREVIGLYPTLLFGMLCYENYANSQTYRPGDW